MGDAGVIGRNNFLFNFFRSIRTQALAQLLSSIIAIPFFKSSNSRRLRSLSLLLMFHLLPMFIAELTDRIVNYDKPDLLHLAITQFGWLDLFTFTFVFIGSFIGSYALHRTEKARLASPQNEKNLT